MIINDFFYVKNVYSAKIAIVSVVFVLIFEKGSQFIKYFLLFLQNRNLILFCIVK
ncbi:hypothetical protein SAMN05444143_1192 [Flavobacterium succinicans]|uniref:Uncharacterized protein n=1 Tax=Flavobacterium succinicans TaxID=29536 RepID=A0A1I4ZWZ8_9FLAO|nr:hypothetical protein SAMN05444143_1192 [Flavobacterium succinicans]